MPPYQMAARSWADRLPRARLGSFSSLPAHRVSGAPGKGLLEASTVLILHRPRTGNTPANVDGKKRDSLHSPLYFLLALPGVPTTQNGTRGSTGVLSPYSQGYTPPKHSPGCAASKPSQGYSPPKHSPGYAPSKLSQGYSPPKHSPADPPTGVLLSAFPKPQRMSALSAFPLHAHKPPGSLGTPAHTPSEGTQRPLDIPAALNRAHPHPDTPPTLPTKIFPVGLPQDP